jgi:hypothetical protein
LTSSSLEPSASIPALKVSCYLQTSEDSDRVEQSQAISVAVVDGICVVGKNVDSQFIKLNGDEILVKSSGMTILSMSDHAWKLERLRWFRSTRAFSALCGISETPQLENRPRTK